MKKGHLYLLAAIVALSLIAGCASPAATPQSSTAPATQEEQNQTSAGADTNASAETTQPITTTTVPAAEAVTLKAWLPPMTDVETDTKLFWETQTQPFQTENNMKLDFEIIPWGSFEEKYLIGVSSATGPDIGYMYLEMIADFIDMGALTPMDDYLTAADKDNFVFLDFGNIQGKQYMLPFSVGGPRILICNMDILNESGVTQTPKTWDEFLEVCLKIKEDQPDIMPIAMPWGATGGGVLNMIYNPFLWQAGGELVDGNNEWSFNSPEGLKAINFLHDLMYVHQVLPEICTSYQDVMQYFVDKKAAMIISSSSGTRDIDKTDINWDFTISLEDKTVGTFISADSFVLMSATKYPDLAMDCMRFMLSGPVMTEFHARMWSEPPVAKDEKYSADPRFEDMYTNQTRYFRTLPAVKGSSRVYDALLKNLQLVMLNEMDAQAALDTTMDYANSLSD